MSNADASWRSWLPAEHALAYVEDVLHALPNDHPVQIALRTYALALALSLGPALLSAFSTKRTGADNLVYLRKILTRDMGVTGFALSMTVAVAGGAALSRVLTTIARSEASEVNEHLLVEAAQDALRPALSRYSDDQLTWLANALSSAFAILLLHSRRRSPPTAAPALPLTMPVSSQDVSPTLDLTLMLVVRALDVAVHSTIFQRARGSGLARQNGIVNAVARVDAFTFWAASARCSPQFRLLPTHI
jgi:hypothetical protein